MSGNSLGLREATTNKEWQFRGLQGLFGKVGLRNGNWVIPLRGFPFPLFLIRLGSSLLGRTFFLLGLHFGPQRG